ncbi:hypothetical protein ADS46_10940 [Halomonas sp. G11]|nr:hypothetical protein ADS46_10940 [Halomonas sp. G11]
MLVLYQHYSHLYYFFQTRAVEFMIVMVTFQNAQMLFQIISLKHYYLVQICHFHVIAPQMVT